MRRFMRRRLPRATHDLFHPLGRNRRLAGRTGLVPQQSIHAFGSKAFLPTADTGLCFPGR